MKPRILLIEDNASTAASLQKVLREEDYDVEIASRGDVGLEQAFREQYHVVITDLRLPGWAGWIWWRNFMPPNPSSPSS